MLADPKWPLGEEKAWTCQTAGRMRKGGGLQGGLQWGLRGVHERQECKALQFSDCSEKIDETMLGT